MGREAPIGERSLRGHKRVLRTVRFGAPCCHHFHERPPVIRGNVNSPASCRALPKPGVARGVDHAPDEHRVRLQLHRILDDEFITLTTVVGSMNSTTDTAGLSLDPAGGGDVRVQWNDPVRARCLEVRDETAPASADARCARPF